MRQVTRGVLVCLLVGGVFALGVYHDVASDEHQRYPLVSDVAADFDAYAGQEMTLGGTVVESTPSADAVRMRVVYGTDSGREQFTVRATGIEQPPQNGADYRVYGTLHPDHRIAVERGIVVNSSPHAELIKFGTSGLGALLILAVFFRSWRIDLQTVSVVPRDNG